MMIRRFFSDLLLIPSIWRELVQRQRDRLYWQAPEGARDGSLRAPARQCWPSTTEELKEFLEGCDRSFMETIRKSREERRLSEVPLQINQDVKEG